MQIAPPVPNQGPIKGSLISSRPHSKLRSTHEMQTELRKWPDCHGSSLLNRRCTTSSAGIIVSLVCSLKTITASAWTGIRDAAHRHDAHFHACVLMSNHMHHLVTPESVPTPSLVLRSVGRRHAGCISHVPRRSGTLWDGRYKSTLIDSDRYLLTCSRHIELNPARAQMVRRPEEYPWSSWRSNTDRPIEPLIWPHPLYLALGHTFVCTCNGLSGFV
jgi:REP element-mobilizing transposase RayT